VSYKKFGEKRSSKMGCFTSRSKVKENESDEKKRTPEKNISITITPDPEIPQTLEERFQQIANMFIVNSVFTGTMQFPDDHSELLELKILQVVERNEKKVTFQTDRPLDFTTGEMSSSLLVLTLELMAKKDWTIKMSYEDVSVPQFLLLEAAGNDAFNLEKCKITGRCGIPKQSAGSFTMVRTVTPNSPFVENRPTRTFSEHTWGAIMDTGSLAHKAYLVHDEKRKSDLALKYSSSKDSIDLPNPTP